MESQEYHLDEAATYADENITYLQEDALFAAPPTLEIVDSAEECEFIGEGDDFECKSIGVRVVVQISTGHLFLAIVKQPLIIQDVRSLDMGLIDLTSVALDGIPNEFASFLAATFNFGVELVEIVPIVGDYLWPEYSSSLTIVPEQMWKYCYIKHTSLICYEADQGKNSFKELVLAEAKACEILRMNPHPNIAKYWGCEVVDGTIRGLCFGKYTMTLSERVETGVPLDIQLCLQGIRAGVAHLHSLGLVHNDINPSNVMMDAGDNPVIIDFDSCTREGEALLKFGTPDWFPETVRTGSRQNDFYALRKMVEYLSRPWEQEAEERRERELMELDGEAEDVQY